MCFPDRGGVVFQVKKRRARDEGLQKNLLTAALSSSLSARIAIAVDDDINIYLADDLLWAIATRVDPRKDLTIVAEGGMDKFSNR